MIRARLYSMIFTSLRLLAVFGLLAALIPPGSAQAASQDTTADRELGQLDFSGTSANRGSLNPDANTLTSAFGIAIDPRNGRLYVADSNNNRILSWPSSASFTDGQSADMLFGQAGYTDKQANRGSASPAANTLSGPYQIAVDLSGNLYATDFYNNRLLVYFDPDSSGDTTADVVFGQAGDFTTNTVNKGSLSASSLYGPAGVAVDRQGNVYVADYNNSRVLIYYTPGAPGGDLAADVVIGQADPFHRLQNRGGTTARNSLANPTSLTLDSQGNLLVADYFNSRVLIYDRPFNTSQYADLELGQADFTHGAANRGGANAAANTLSAPGGVAVDAYGNIFVADFSNSRILKYLPPIITNGQDADQVFGQINFLSNTPNQGGAASEATLSYPYAVLVDPAGNLYTGDRGNNRLLEYDRPAANPMPILTQPFPQSVAAGSPDFTLNLIGSGFGPDSIVKWLGVNQSTQYLNSFVLQGDIPAAAVSAAGTAGVKVYTPAPGGGVSVEWPIEIYNRTTGDRSADLVIGQPNFASIDPNNSGVSAYSLSSPTGIAIDPNSGRVYAADYNNHRVLGWPNLDGYVNGQAADMVFGQAGFINHSPNSGGISAKSLNYPVGLAVDQQGNLYVADSANNRVLEYEHPAGVGGDTTADQVFGQPNMTSGLGNQGGAPGAGTLNDPYAVALDSSGNLFVADYNNHRVLIYRRPLAPESDQIADMVIGQTGFDKNIPGADTDGLRYPSGVAVDGWGNLYVSDYQNNRVLEYDAPLVFDNHFANRVFGQAKFTDTSCNQGNLIPSASSLCSPAGVAIDRFGNLLVADLANARVLRYIAPTSPASDTIADNVLGHSDFTGYNQEFGRSGLAYPWSIVATGEGNILVSDVLANRITAYDQPFAEPAPGLGTLYPSEVASGSPAFTLSAIGFDLGPDSVVQLDSANLSTTYLHDGLLQSSVPAGSVPVAGAKDVKVYTPPLPGDPSSGGTSSPKTLSIYNRAPLDTAADLVFGQPGFSTDDSNIGGLGRMALNIPAGTAIDQSTGRIFVSDYNNSRILGWPDLPTYVNGQPADLVIGQPDFYSNACNQGFSSPTASTLCTQRGIALDGNGNLFAADYSNNRVLVYQPPFASGMAAAHVIGQADMSGMNCNRSLPSPNALTLCYPVGLMIDRLGNLWVSDSFNNRVLEYNQPLINVIQASRVFGQPGFITQAPGIGPDGLSNPAGLAMDAADHLYVADWINNRVLEYDDAIAGSDTAADRVFGQPDFNKVDTGLGAGGLNTPFGVATDAYGNLFVADAYNSRVLEYDQPADGGDTQADRVFGQDDFNTGLPDPVGTATRDSISYPSNVMLDASGNLFVSDSGNNRVLVFDTPLPNPLPALTSMLPNSAPAGAPGFTLTVNGSNFGPQTVIKWNGSPRPTTYVSMSQLQVEVSAADIASGGTASLTAYTPAPGGGESGPLSFTVNNPLPALTSLNPVSVNSGGADFNLIVNGSNFVSASVVYWNGVALPTTFVNTTKLTANVTAQHIATAGSAVITVSNPTPGGGASGPLTFTIIQGTLMIYLPVVIQ